MEIQSFWEQQEIISHQLFMNVIGPNFQKANNNCNYETADKGTHFCQTTFAVITLFLNKGDLRVHSE